MNCARLLCLGRMWNSIVLVPDVCLFIYFVLLSGCNTRGHKCGLVSERRGREREGERGKWGENGERRRI